VALTKVRRGGTDTGISDASDATAITIDSSERVGIGITPDTTSNGKSLQINRSVINDDDGGSTHIAQNGYYNSAWKYVEDGTAEKISLVSGTIRFDNASSNSSGADASLSWSERMRIDSSGRLLIGTTSTVIDGDQTLHVSGAQGANMQATVSSADGGSVLNLKRSGNSQGDYLRLFNSSNGETGQIRVDSGGTTQFENVSDYRLKENIKDWDVDAIAKVKQIKIKTFDWKDQTAVTNGKGLIGVIAHELQEVYPHCVSGEKDGYGGDLDKDGNKKPMYQGVDYGKLTPLLTKALQEALARIETLEAKVTALESK